MKKRSKNTDYVKGMIQGIKWAPELFQGTNEASFQEVIWSWKVKAE